MKKKLMKRFLVCILSLLSIFLIAGCNDGSAPKDDGPASDAGDDFYDFCVERISSLNCDGEITVIDGEYYFKVNNKISFSSPHYYIPDDDCFVDSKTFPVTEKTQYNGEAVENGKPAEGKKYQADITLIYEHSYEYVFGAPSEELLDNPYFKLKKYHGMQYYVFVSNLTEI